MKYMLPVVFVLLGGAMASSAFASNSVTVTNNVSTNTSTSSTGSNQTHVEIETNGVKKTFDSSGQDVHWQSDDGSSKVDINNNGSSTSVDQSQQDDDHTSVSVHANGSTTVTPQPSSTPKPDEDKQQQKENVNHASPFSWLKDFFSSFFKTHSTNDQKKLHIFGFTFSY